jgi:hypothetical protein
LLTLAPTVEINYLPMDDKNVLYETNSRSAIPEQYSNMKRLYVFKEAFPDVFLVFFSFSMILLYFYPLMYIVLRKPCDREKKTELEILTDLHVLGTPE